MARGSASSDMKDTSATSDGPTAVRATPINFAAPTTTAATGEPGGYVQGAVNIAFSATTPLPDDARIFFTRHQNPHGKQHVLVARTGKEVSLALPVGEYSMQIQARGFETYRALVEVDPQRPAKVNAAFEPRKSKPRTFEERLAKYGVDAATVEIGDLDVPPRTVRSLNHAGDCCDKRGFRMLYADSIAKMKQWIGSDDARFGHDRPVFGPLPPMDKMPSLDAETERSALSQEHVKAITAIANEYVNGNSRAVQRYEPVLNAAIKLTTRDLAAKMFPFHFYRLVTIGAGATLEVGNGSAIFTCDELRIHKTGKLTPVNSVTIEIGTYTEFG